jgi:malate-CoA ligase subunit alpha
MGHAGAIVSSVGESAEEKAVILRDCGLTVVDRPSDLGTVMAGVLRA